MNQILIFLFSEWEGTGVPYVFYLTVIGFLNNIYKDQQLILQDYT